MKKKRQAINIFTERHNWISFIIFSFMNYSLLLHTTTTTTTARSTTLFPFDLFTHLAKVVQK